MIYVVLCRILLGCLDHVTGFRTVSHMLCDVFQSKNQHFARCERMLEFSLFLRFCTVRHPHNSRLDNLSESSEWPGLGFSLWNADFPSDTPVGQPPFPIRPVQFTS